MNNLAWGFFVFGKVGEAANQFLDSHCTISDAGSEKTCCAWIKTRFMTFIMSWNAIIEVKLVLVCHELLKLDSSREDKQDRF